MPLLARGLCRDAALSGLPGPLSSGAVAVGSTCFACVAACPPSAADGTVNAAALNSIKLNAKKSRRPRIIAMARTVSYGMFVIHGPIDPYPYGQCRSVARGGACRQPLCEAPHRDRVVPAEVRPHERCSEPVEQRRHEPPVLERDASAAIVPRLE